MQPKTATLERWQFSASVLLPVVLALVITAAAVLGFVFWSTVNIDQRALERQSSMVSQLIEAKRARMEHDLESVGIWDDAVVNTKLMFNFNWVDNNLGEWMYDYFGHDRSVVLGANDHPLYMMEDGASVVPDQFSQISTAIMPMVERLRTLRGIDAGPTLTQDRQCLPILPLSRACQPSSAPSPSFPIPVRSFRNLALNPSWSA